jgi:hypothetical protein
MQVQISGLWAASVFLIFGSVATAQSLGSGGTVEGAVTDPSGAAVSNARVEIRNPLSGYERAANTDAMGTFRFTNVPPNPYHLEVTAPGFGPYQQDISVRSAVPISLKVALVIAGGQTTVVVEGSGADLLENVPYAHNDIDRTTYAKLPTLSPGSSLSDAITFGSPGVVADSNGFFHPLGDHAQTTFSIDNQPISDQQTKQFSTQMPLNAIQSMELITGAPGAEFGDKTSLIVNAVTRSGLGRSLSEASLLNMVRSERLARRPRLAWVAQSLEISWWRTPSAPGAFSTPRSSARCTPPVLTKPSLTGSTTSRAQWTPST